MILYEVTLQVDPTKALAVEAHMRREHIPDIFASGCFRRIRFDRASPARFRTSYEARTESDLERYLQEHAPRLRADFQAHFPSGVTVTRETWTPLESWA
jgi:uncharacterized protein DUF4286